MRERNTKGREARRSRHARAGICALLLALASLGGCASSVVTRYYTLAGPVTAVDAAPSMQLAIAPVTVPESLARPQLVVSRAAGTATGQLDILEQSRWASDFDEELRRAFADAITTELRASDVSLGGELADLPVWRIGIQLRRYDAVPGDRVAMTFGWVFGRSDRSVQFACQGSRIVALTSREPEEVVRGVRAAVAGIAADITGQVRRAAASNLAGDGRGVCLDPAAQRSENSAQAVVQLGF